MSKMQASGRVRPGEIEATLAFLSTEAVRQHEGEWVAILDCRVLAHGPDAKEVHDEALAKAPGSEPILHLVSSETWIV